MAADGVYKQYEEFIVSTTTIEGMTRTLRLSLAMLEALHEVTGQLLARRREAASWPYGEIPREPGRFLPVVRSEKNATGNP